MTQKAKAPAKKSPKPEDVRFVRTSERRDFARCPQRWWWGYVEGLKPLHSKPALVFGDLIHQALAAYYIPGNVRGPLPYDTLMDLWEQYEPDLTWIYDGDGEREGALELGFAMLENYVAWASERDKQYEIIAPEQTFQVHLYDGRTYLRTYVGTVDALVRDLLTNKIGFFEHKTTKAIPPPYWLQMDEQAGSYWAFTPEWLRAQGIMKPDEDMDFILYNFLKKSMADARPKNDAGQSLNKDGSVSKQQPGELFYREAVYRNPSARQKIKERAVAQIKTMDALKAGEATLVKNITGDCRWDCAFKDMCQLHEEGADWEAYRDAMFKTWQPYEDHAPIPTEETR